MLIASGSGLVVYTYSSIKECMLLLDLGLLLCFLRVAESVIIMGSDDIAPDNIYFIIITSHTGLLMILSTCT